MDKTIDVKSRYDSRYYAQICCGTFDADAYLIQLAGQIRDLIRLEGHALSYLGLSGQGQDGALCKVDLSDTGQEVRPAHTIGSRCVDLPVVLHTCAVCPPTALTRIIDQAIQEVSDAYSLSVVVFDKGCSEMTDLEGDQYGS